MSEKQSVDTKKPLSIQSVGQAAADTVANIGANLQNLLTSQQAQQQLSGNILGTTGNILDTGTGILDKLVGTAEKVASFGTRLTTIVQKGVLSSTDLFKILAQPIPGGAIVATIIMILGLFLPGPAKAAGLIVGPLAGTAVGALLKRYYSTVQL